MRLIDRRDLLDTQAIYWIEGYKDAINSRKKACPIGSQYGDDINYSFGYNYGIKENELEEALSEDTNFDEYLKKQLKVPDFATRFLAAQKVIDEAMSEARTIRIEEIFATGLPLKKGEGHALLKRIRKFLDEEK